MAVGAACSGTHRWRALGRAANYLCPLHQKGLQSPLALRCPLRRDILAISRPVPFPTVNEAPSAQANAASTIVTSNTQANPQTPSFTIPFPPSSASPKPPRRSLIPIAAFAALGAAGVIIAAISLFSLGISSAVTATAATSGHTASALSALPLLASVTASLLSSLFKVPTLSMAAAPLASTTATAASNTAAANHHTTANLLITLASALPHLGLFLLCLSASAFLLACLPGLAALARTAVRAERLLAAVEAELPDTVAALRITGLEVTDCIQELGALGGELTRGVRSTAALAVAAEAGVRQGVAVAEAGVRQGVATAAKVEKEARGAVEGHLASTAQLSYSAPLVAQAAAATRTAARKLRTGLAVGQLAGAVVQAGRSARDALVRQQQLDEQQRLLAVRQEQLPGHQQQQQQEAALLQRQLEALQEKQRRQQQQLLATQKQQQQRNK
ncbi:hypothetical protein Agub_g7543 [Astrephomene gubernaculifera]|uniref:Uncharacterized protein n=1 Tax=Astrephomene gubernaculifera TaxID=47775 RepID=A0AAD3DT03_9CHLO|nr:hypothetical protein Agub_g7543 [Astrephomene gubernaculifera]